MRLDKFLCDTLNIVRTEAKKMVSSGRVTVDDIKAKSGSQQLSEEAKVCLDGAPLTYQRYFYIMLNKTAGVVCANRDSKSKTVFDLLDKEDLKKDLFVCGRLDKDTTGFVLITDDGDFAHRILSPKNHIFKTYIAGLQHELSDEDIKSLENGITLGDGTVLKEAKVEVIEGDKPFVRIMICEGKYHQVKRMFAATGNKVVSLHRLKMGQLQLDDSLKPGECREITPEELILVTEK
mgnify:CR=1 FL=1